MRRKLTDQEKADRYAARVQTKIETAAYDLAEAKRDALRERRERRRVRKYERVYGEFYAWHQTLSEAHRHVLGADPQMAVMNGQVPADIAIEYARWCDALRRAR